MIAFLMRDFCQSRPKVCGPAVEALTACLCPLERPSVPEPFDVEIYHNPACGTSRTTVAIIRNAGLEPHVIEYVKTPPPGSCWCSSSPVPPFRCGRSCARRVRPTPN